MSLFWWLVADNHLENQQKMIENQKLQMGKYDEVAKKVKSDGNISCTAYCIIGVICLLIGIPSTDSTAFIFFVGLGVALILLGIVATNNGKKKAQKILEDAKQEKEKKKQQIIEEERLRAEIRAEIEAEKKSKKKGK